LAGANFQKIFDFPKRNILFDNKDIFENNNKNNEIFME